MTKVAMLLNNSFVCAVCRRRAMGLAVGKPGRAAWFCEACGASPARKVMEMGQENFDGIERAAMDLVLAELPDRIEVEPQDRREFLEWLIKSFGDNLRKTANDHAPF